MNLSRRTFAKAGLASLAFAGCSRVVMAQAAIGLGSYRNEVLGYGPLRVDAAGLFDLPEGFSYTVISRAGEEMSDGLLVPDHFDGMGCLPLPGGKVALVRNHELSVDGAAKGAAGTDAARAAKLAESPFYGRDSRGAVMPGGTTTVVYDPATGKTENQFLSLAGTTYNCAGGITPWGSWLTCEESVVAAPDVERSHGWVFEVPASATARVTPVPLKAMGRFRHEAVAIDPLTGIAYLTEDREDGLFYRFIPKVPGKLAKGGRLQALALSDGRRDTRNWNGQDIAVQEPAAVRWIDLDDVESPNDDLRQRGHAAGAARFARGEGIHLGQRADGSSEFYFTATSGGKRGLGQIFRYVPAPKGAPANKGGTLDLFVESRDADLLEYGDNLTVAPNGHLIVCEDRAGDKTNYLRGVTPKGQLYTIGRLTAETELAGVCFSPDGQVMFLNAYSPGRTLAIRGPWDRLITE